MPQFFIQMLQRILFGLVLISNCLVQAQITQPNKPIQKEVIIRGDDNNLNLPQDSLKVSRGSRPSDSLQTFVPKITDYLYWTESQQQYTAIDTTLTIQNFYKQNFTSKDLFGKMMFPNIGQSLNPLEYQAQNSNRIQLMPTGKSFNFIAPEEVRYFDVKTPISELFYENGVREGQILSTTFSHSLNKYWNYSVRYRGLRSLGRYQEQLASNTGFFATLSHQSKNNRLRVWSHYASQAVDNEENGGIQNLEDFTNEDVAGGLDGIAVNLNGAKTEFDSRRFHLGASYALFKSVNKQDSTTYFPIRLKNKFSYEKQKYAYENSSGSDTAQNDAFFNSPTISGANRRNQKNFESTKNTTTAEFKWGKKLNVEAGIVFENLKLYANEGLQDGLINIPQGVEDNLIGLIGKFDFDWNQKIKLTANAQLSSGNFFGNTYHVDAVLSTQPIKGYKVSGGLLAQSTYPSLNLVYNQSFYENYNFFNQNFSNQNTQKIFGKIESDQYKTSIEAAAYNIDNYTYLDANSRPKQLGETLNLFKFRVNNHLQYQFFHLNTTLQYQQVTNQEEALPLPDYLGRLTLYYQNHAFNHAAQVQIGANLNYFGKFKSREFFPILNEFQLQEQNGNEQEIGNFPLLDFFINMKVKRMRIYLRADHIFGAFGKNNYFSTPQTPFRDFKVQFGIHWFLFT